MIGEDVHATLSRLAAREKQLNGLNYGSNYQAVAEQARDRSMDVLNPLDSISLRRKQIMRTPRLCCRHPAMLHDTNGFAYLSSSR
jgi:hypothetical protein